MKILANTAQMTILVGLPRPHGQMDAGSEGNFSSTSSAQLQKKITTGCTY